MLAGAPRSWPTRSSSRAGPPRKPSNLHIFVDAATGAVLDKRDYVPLPQTPPPCVEGTGNGYYYGNVTINTSRLRHRRTR